MVPGDRSRSNSPKVSPFSSTSPNFNSLPSISSLMCCFLLQIHAQAHKCRQFAAGGSLFIRHATPCSFTLAPFRFESPQPAEGAAEKTGLVVETTACAVPAGFPASVEQLNPTSQLSLLCGREEADQDSCSKLTQRQRASSVCR